MKGSRQQFMQQLLGSSKFKIINGNGMRKLSNGNVVKCVISTTTTFEQYEKLTITITNITDGKLDRTDFRFNDNLKHAPNTHPNANVKDGLKVILHCGWNWYINKPTESSVKSMVTTIEEHISFFGE